MDRNKLSLEPHHLGVPSCASKTFLSLWYVWRKPCTYLAPTVTPPPNRLKRDSRWPMSPRSSSGCVKNDFWASDTFSTNHASILHQDLHYLQMDRKKLPFEPRHLGVPSGASKTISKPMVRLVQTVHLSCIDTNTISKRTETRIYVPQVT
jgi:hypothetical protein